MNGLNCKRRFYTLNSRKEADDHKRKSTVEISAIKDSHLRARLKEQRIVTHITVT